LPLTNWALTAAAQSMAVIIERGMRVICATLPFVNRDYLPKLIVAGESVPRVSKCSATYPSARTSTWRVPTRRTRLRAPVHPMPCLTLNASNPRIPRNLGRLGTNVWV
jgi:hypothetical protein